MQKLSSLKRQAGVSLVEFMLGAGLLGLGMIPIFQMSSQSQQDTKVALAAQHHKLVLNAVDKYVQANYASLIASATPTTPAKITVANLIAANLLPSGFSATNSYGQTQCALVLEPTANNLSVMATSEGGTAMSDLELSGAAMLIGASGGGIYSSNPAVAAGANGGWQISASTTPTLANFTSTNCSGTTVSVGHLTSSLYYSNSTLTTDFLHRSDVPGQPTLTAMNTPLGLVTRIKDASCGTSAGTASENKRIATDSNGTVMACQDAGGGNWKWSQVGGGFWKDPVATYASLPSSGNNTGDVRLTFDTQRAFSWNGSSWVALAIDQNGNLTVPGILTANKIVTPAGNSVQVGQTYLYGDNSNSALRQSGSLYVQNQNGTANANVIANDYYIASKGKWASQVGALNQNSCYWTNPYSGCAQVLRPALT